MIHLLPSVRRAGRALSTTHDAISISSHRTWTATQLNALAAARDGLRTHRQGIFMSSLLQIKTLIMHFNVYGFVASARTISANIHTNSIHPALI